MKKFLKTILFLCAISSLAYAEEATAVAKMCIRDRDSTNLTIDDVVNFISKEIEKVK